ncbi:MAG: thioredoxin family protein [Candidatus Thorarchaeota archaeon]
MAPSDEEGCSKDGKESSKVEVLFFSHDECPFCPRAKQVLLDILGEFDTDMFTLREIDVVQEPEVAQYYGVLAAPTIMIGGASITGIPEPESILRMILGYRKRRGVPDDRLPN